MDVAVGSIGMRDAVAVGVEGSRVEVGDAVGEAVIGAGVAVGIIVGNRVGVNDEAAVGVLLGVDIGVIVGTTPPHGNAPIYVPFSPPVQAGELICK
jgi:hypothetical protein